MILGASRSQQSFLIISTQSVDLWLLKNHEAHSKSHFLQILLSEFFPSPLETRIFSILVFKDWTTRLASIIAPLPQKSILAFTRPILRLTEKLWKQVPIILCQFLISINYLLLQLGYRNIRLWVTDIQLNLASLQELEI